MAADFIAGCIGGCAGIIVGYPLDTVKVHLQAQDARTPFYKGSFHCIQTVIYKQGIRGLYSGLTSPLAGTVSINALLFGVHGNVRRTFSDPDSLSTHFLAGCAAGLFQTVISSPTELVKVRAQVTGNNLHLFHCLKRIYKCEGIRGVFRGLVITTIRDIPASGTYFVTYEALTRRHDGKSISTTRMLLAGGVAGCISWAVIYPFDVIKSRVQVDGMGIPPKYSGWWDCFRKSVRLEGYGILGRGLSATMVRAFPTNAAIFTATTWSLRIMRGEELVLHWPGSEFSLPRKLGILPNPCCSKQGCAGIIVGHPLDTVKAHLQTQNAKTPIYKGTFHCLQTVIVKEGAKGLYRGLSSPLSAIAGINAIIFGVYGNIQRRCSDPNALLTHLLAGCTAGFVQTGICSPMELAKLRAQVSGSSLGPLKFLKEVYKCEGLKGVYRGVGITTAREIPAFGSYFITYEAMSRTSDGSKVSTLQMMIAGGTAGCVSWGIVYPVDVIKSRIQIDGMNGVRKYKGAWDCYRKSVAAEGYTVLGRGLTPTLLRAFPTNAATFTAVTWSLRILSGEMGFEEGNEETTSSWLNKCENAITGFAGSSDVCVALT